MEGNSYFNTRFSFDRRRDSLWKVVCAYLQKYISQDSKVLDIGAGYCSFINNITASEKHALDCSANLMGNAAKGVICHQGSFELLNKISGSYFDVIFISNLFEHLSDSETDYLITQIKRILKKESGRLIILQPNFRYSYKVYFDDFTHTRIFTHRSMVDFLEANSFKVVKLFKKFLPFSMKSAVPKFPFLVRLYLLLSFKPFAGQMLIISKLQC